MKVILQPRYTGKAKALIEFNNIKIEEYEKLINSLDTSVFEKAFYEDLRNRLLASNERLKEYLQNECDM